MKGLVDKALSYINKIILSIAGKCFYLSLPCLAFPGMIICQGKVIKAYNLIKKMSVSFHNIWTR